MTYILRLCAKSGRAARKWYINNFMWWLWQSSEHLNKMTVSSKPFKANLKWTLINCTFSRPLQAVDLTQEQENQGNVVGRWP